MEPRTFFSVIRKSLFAIAIAAITIPAAARSSMDVDPFKKLANIQYLGSQNQSLMFTVTYNNINAARFFVTIKDENGETLFQGAFTDSKFNKKFILPKTEASRLIFIISDKKNRHSETFEVNTQTRMVEDVMVRKLQ
ncbi:hypothetical protein [Agriterribacter sp.]|uniref:hypothetical protein n=1 Tax=Agriterribacter sp. TaxID=2821509 RepID=UPI002B6CB20C|nr:hypothetical protein [Agriterribacter sp.]HTN08051.1 hypothetical protein [Agriterribacter sp.]